MSRGSGQAKDQPVEALRARRNDGQPVPSQPAADVSAPPARSASDEPPLDAPLDEFWALGEEFAELRFSIEPPIVPAAVLKRLGSPFPGEEGERFMSELARLYRTISERAIRSALD